MGDRKPLELVGTSTATTYRFRSPEPLGGWACCTVNDATGELTITSDWGNWGHRWNTAHLGCPTLTEFLGDVSGVDYLIGKLLGSRDRRVFDPDATTTALRKMLLERRRVDGYAINQSGLFTADGYPRIPRWDGKEWLTKEAARRIWDKLGDLADCGGSLDLYLERLPDGFHELVCEEPWNYYCDEESSESKALAAIVLPPLIAACGAEAARRAAAASAPLEPAEVARG